MSDHTDALRELEADLAALERLRRYNALNYYRPYPKQRLFHELGATKRQRLLTAGNQLGKTTSGGGEAAYHATGRYPADWKGRVFTRPNVGYVGGPTGELVRDGAQRVLLGRAGVADALGTGLIPLDAIFDKPTTARGTPDGVDYVLVRHVSGGVSTIKFKNYAQGRIAWQSDTVDWVWFDEEPPADIYSEGLTRTNSTLGPVWVTFTPLQGFTQVVARFLRDPGPDTAVVKMSIRDAEHYTDAERDAIIASYPSHERVARVEGDPVLGSGAIFPIAEERISIEPFEVPRYWPRIGALDFGYDHPFAAVELVKDPVTETVYVTRCFRDRQTTPVQHALVLKEWGGLNWAWPHDGLQHSKDSGEQLARQYRKAGLSILAHRATFEDGSNGVEAGLLLMLGMMEKGKFRVFSNCGEWFEEFRVYHRKDGKVVKLADDLLSATRYGVMMLRYARPLIATGTERPRQTTAIMDD